MGGQARGKMQFIASAAEQQAGVILIGPKQRRLFRQLSLNKFRHEAQLIVLRDTPLGGGPASVGAEQGAE